MKILYLTAIFLYSPTNVHIFLSGLQLLGSETLCLETVPPQKKVIFKWPSNSLGMKWLKAQ